MDLAFDLLIKITRRPAIRERALKRPSGPFEKGSGEGIYFFKGHEKKIKNGIEISLRTITTVPVALPRQKKRASCTPQPHEKRGSTGEVTVRDDQSELGIITDPVNHKDLTHFSPRINEWMIEAIRHGRQAPVMGREDLLTRLKERPDPCLTSAETAKSSRL